MSARLLVIVTFPYHFCLLFMISAMGLVQPLFELLSLALPEGRLFLDLRLQHLEVVRQLLVSTHQLSVIVFDRFAEKLHRQDYRFMGTKLSVNGKYTDLGSRLESWTARLGGVA